MSLPFLTPSIRVRRTPYSRRVEQAGVKAYTVYNHMLLPQFFTSVEEDYAHLKRAVQVWDVACERQVEIRGADARRLLQMTTPRDVTRMQDDQCFYVPMVDAAGGIMNDPIAVKLAQDRYWLSLADSDMLYYCKGLASGMGLDVEVFEPDVSPLAVQGPKADELMARVFGPGIRDTRFFRYQWVEFMGRTLLAARSGWSHQGGFEIYLEGADLGEALWDALFEAGEDLDVRAGCPNNIERIEAGLLSWGSDMTIDNTPFEAGLGKYCQLDKATDCLGHAALLARQIPERQIRALAIDGEPVPSIRHYWPLSDDSGAPAGRVSSAIWSPVYQTNVAIAMVEKTHWDAGTRLRVATPDGDRGATVRPGFWI
jgi:dimethylsulfoniopropionate demethylase